MKASGAECLNSLILELLSELGLVASICVLPLLLQINGCSFVILSRKLDLEDVLLWDMFELKAKDAVVVLYTFEKQHLVREWNRSKVHLVHTHPNIDLLNYLIE